MFGPTSSIPPNKKLEEIKNILKESKKQSIIMSILTGVNVIIAILIYLK